MTGKYKLVYDFKYDGGGLGKGTKGIIIVDGIKMADKRISGTQPGIFSVDDFEDVGTDENTSVADYGSAAQFNGHVKKLTIDISSASLR